MDDFIERITRESEAKLRSQNIAEMMAKPFDEKRRRYMSIDEFIRNYSCIKEFKNKAVLILYDRRIKEFSRKELAEIYREDSLAEEHSDLITSLMLEAEMNKDIDLKPKRKTKYRIRCIETGELFDSVRQAAYEFGISTSAVYRDLSRGHVSQWDRCSFEKVAV